MIFSRLNRYLFHLLTIGILLLAGACQPAQITQMAPTLVPTATPSDPVTNTTPSPQSTAPTTLSEHAVRLLPLVGPLQTPQAELSGLAWYADMLILLPQYPERFVQSNLPESFGALFAIPKAEILAYLSGQSKAPFNPRPVPLFATGLKQKISGYEGFESIVFSGDSVYLTIETHQTGGMVALLVSGEISPDLSKVTLDSSRLADISAQASIPNFSDEAISLINQQVITFYEGNGARVTPRPVAHIFDLNLNPHGVVFSPSLEYRITDATPADPDGRFWVINYFYPGDTAIAPASDPLFERFGIPPSHKQSKAVERLVQLQWDAKIISLVSRPPIYLQLLADGTARNWEGLAQLDTAGFLLVTDSFPSTLLGFVALP